MWPFSVARPVNDRVARAWWIVFLLFISLMIGQGMRSSFGVMVEPWEEQFASSRSVISLAGSLNLLFYAIGQPLVGWLVNLYDGKRVLAGGMLLLGASIGLTPFVPSFWMLLLLYGMVGGIGFALVGQIAAAVVTTRWFVQGRGTVLGIVQSGGSVGRLTTLPMVLLLVASYGWEHTYFMIGGLMVLLLAPLLYLVIDEHESKSQSAGEPPDLRKSLRKLLPSRNDPFWRDTSYLALVGSFFICGYTTSGLFSTHIIPFANERGYLETTVAFSLVLLGLLDFIGTMSAGALADRLNRRRMLQFFYGTRALTYLGFFLMAAFPQMPSYAWLLVLLAALFGIFDFATVPVTTSLTADLTDSDRFPVAISWVSFSHQIGAAFGSFIPGYLYDITGNYILAFGTAVLLLCLAVVFCHWVRVARPATLSTSFPSVASRS